MARMTNAQLVDENIKLRAHCAVLEQRLTAAQECYATAVEELNKLTVAVAQHVSDPVAAPATQRVKGKTIYEFDPSKKGDFIRASQLAKQFGGLVRRAQQ